MLKTSYCFVMEMFKKAYGARQKQINKLSLWDDSWSLPNYSNWKKNVSWIDWKCSKALEIWDVRLFDGSYHFSNTGTGNGYMFSKLEYGLSLCAKKSWQIKPMLVSRLVVSVATNIWQRQTCPKEETVQLNHSADCKLYLIWKLKCYRQTSSLKMLL